VDRINEGVLRVSDQRAAGSSTSLVFLGWGGSRGFSCRLLLTDVGHQLIEVNNQVGADYNDQQTCSFTALTTSPEEALSGSNAHLKCKPREGKVLYAVTNSKVPSFP